MKQIWKTAESEFNITNTGTGSFGQKTTKQVKNFRSLPLDTILEPSALISKTTALTHTVLTFLCWKMAMVVDRTFEFVSENFVL